MFFMVIPIRQFHFEYFICAAELCNYVNTCMQSVYEGKVFVEEDEWLLSMAVGGALKEHLMC